MTVKLNIDRLVVDVPAGQRINSAALKAAVERQLSGMIENGSAGACTSAPVKTLTHGAHSENSGVRNEARLARDMATQIYEAMKR